METIRLKVERLFRPLPKKRGELCVNPVTLDEFVRDESGSGSIAYQMRVAGKALWARQWFAWCGPRDAPPLPLSYTEWEDMRHCDGLPCLVGFYARSLSRQRWEIHLHPSFEEFASGLLAAQSGGWDLPSRAGRQIAGRYPPARLTGMTPGLFWAPSKEYFEIRTSYHRARLRAARRAGLHP